MRKTTPVFWINRKAAYPCAIPLKSQTDLQHKYPKGNQQPLFFASFAINSLFTEKKTRRRPVSQDCIHHHEVLIGGGGFQGSEISRPFNGLVPSSTVCDGDLAGQAAFWAWTRRRVSSREITFPKAALVRPPSDTMSVRLSG
jgi:hypothetical protein